MKRLAYVWGMVLVVEVLLQVSGGYAQSPIKKSLPAVPVTYSGDTDETIIRRAKLIEGAKKEGVLVRWGSDKPDEAGQIFAGFSKIYPFIKLNYASIQDNQRNFQLESEHLSGRVTVDICDAGGDELYPRRRKMGLTATYTEFIPGINKRDKRSYSKYGDWAQPGNNAIVPLYNTKLVSAAEAPKSWEDLLDPKWKGQMAMITDVKPWFVFALAEGGWGLEKTDDYLGKIGKQNLIWAPGGQSAALGLLMAGEFKICIWNNIRFAFRGQDRGDPVGWARVSPVPVTGGTFLLTKLAPHPNAARLYIEWLFSPQGLAVYEKVTGYADPSPGSGSRLSKELAGLPLMYRTEEVVLKTAELNLSERFSKILGVIPK